MAKGPEGRLQHHVDALFKEMMHNGVPLWYLKVHGDEKQKGGIPDYIGCINGRFFGLELKAGNNVPTPRQLLTLRLIKQAGGITGVAWDLDQVKQFLARCFDSKDNDELRPHPSTDDLPSNEPEGD